MLVRSGQVRLDPVVCLYGYVCPCEALLGMARCAVQVLRFSLSRWCWRWMGNGAVTCLAEPVESEEYVSW